MSHQHIEQDSSVFTFCFLDKVVFSIWKRVYFTWDLLFLDKVVMFGIVCRVDHQYISYCKRVLFCYDFPIHVQYVTFYRNKAIQLVLWNSRYMFGWHVFFPLWHQHRAKEKKKKKSKTPHRTLFNLDSLLYGVLFQFEVQIECSFVTREITYLLSVLLFISCGFLIDTSEKCDYCYLRCSSGTLILNYLLSNYC